MDAFTWIVIVALAVCVLMHLFGHGHGHAGHGKHREHQRPEVGHRDREDEASSGHAVSGTSSGHSRGRGGCH